MMALNLKDKQPLMSGDEIRTAMLRAVAKFPEAKEALLHMAWDLGLDMDAHGFNYGFKDWPEGTVSPPQFGWRPDVPMIEQ